MNDHWKITRKIVSFIVMMLQHCIHLELLSRKDKTPITKWHEVQGTKTKSVKKVQAMQNGESLKEGEIRYPRSEHLLLGMPHPSHITWILIDVLPVMSCIKR